MLDEAEIREHLEGHAVRNAALLKTIQNRGIDLGQSHSVEHHFWANSQQSAALLARELYGRGYLILVISPEAGNGSRRWNVEAGIRRKLEDAGGSQVTEELVRLAGSFDALYDGWGVSL